MARVEFSQLFGLMMKLMELMPEVEFIGESGDDSIILQAMETKEDVEVARIRQMGAVTTTVVRMVQDYLTSCDVREDEVLMKEDGSPLDDWRCERKDRSLAGGARRSGCGRRHLCDRARRGSATFGWQSQRSDDIGQNHCL